MTLQAYLGDAKMNFSEFARRIHVSPETVRRYVAGERTPEWKIIERIFLATAGKVTPNDWLAGKVAA